MLRSAKWLLRILAAAFAGAVVRLARRWSRKRPRIWHGFWPLHFAADHARADRLAGYESYVVGLQLSHMPYEIYERTPFDIIWEDLGVVPRDRHWHSLEHLLLHGDIWIPFFDCLFFPGRTLLNELSFRLIKAAGIRIIAVTQAGDIVHKPRWVTRFDWVGRWQQSYPNWDLEQHIPAARQRIDTFCRFAEMVIPDGPYTARFLPRRDLVFKYFPVDIELNRMPDTPPPRREGDPIIVHAINHRPVKGTDFVLATAERLRELGYAFDLRIIERVPRLEAIAIYQSAAFALDQFCMGSFGCFAMECLSLGKPVVSYTDQEELGLPQYNLPFLNGNRDNLDEIVAVLLRLPELRDRIGVVSRAVAERYLSFAALGEVWARIYDHVWWGAPLDLTSTAIFDKTRPARSFTEDPAQPEFWPVDVSDLLPQIREIVAEFRQKSEHIES
jgi:hypothetical protein